MINDSTPTHRPVDKTVNRVGSCTVLAGGWIPTHDRRRLRRAIPSGGPIRCVNLPKPAGCWATGRVWWTPAAR